MKPHIHTPHGDDEIRLAGDQGEQLAGDRAEATTDDVGAPQDGGGPSLLLSIAQDSAEVYRRHLAALVDLWDSLGVMGFVCARQDKVTEFLAKLHEVKCILRQ